MEIQDVSTESKYLKAKEKVEAIKGFYGHLFVYTIVISVLAFINYNTTSFAWFLFPAFGWGFGLVSHGLGAYDYNPFFGKDWEARKIQEFMKNS